MRAGGADRTATRRAKGVWTTDQAMNASAPSGTSAPGFGTSLDATRSTPFVSETARSTRSGQSPPSGAGERSVAAAAVAPGRTS